MAVDQDEFTDVANLIKTCWPDFAVTEFNLRNPQSEFVIAFYEQFISETNQKLAISCGEEANYFAEVRVNPDDDQVTSLYWHVATIFKKLGLRQSYFTFTDLVKPTSRRTIVNFKLAINFFLYLQSKVPVIKDIIDSVKVKEESCRNAEKTKDSIKTEINQLAEKIARKEDELVKLKEKHGHCESSLEELNKKRDTDERESENLKKKLLAIKTECKEKSANVKRLQQQEKLLTKEIVSPSEYEQLLESSKNLKAEILDIENISESYNSTLVEKKKNIQHFESLANNLARNDLGPLEEVVHTLENKLAQMKIKEKAVSDKTNEVQNLKGKLIQSEENIAVINEKIQSTEIITNTTKVKMNEEIKMATKHLAKAETQFNDLKKEGETLQHQIEEAKAACTQTQKEIDTLNEFYQKTYQKMLKMQSDFTTEFHDAMLNIENFGK